VFIGHGLTQDTRALLIDGTLDAVINQQPQNLIMNSVRIFTNLRQRRIRSSVSSRSGSAWSCGKTSPKAHVSGATRVAPRRAPPASDRLRSRRPLALSLAGSFHPGRTKWHV
jgi:hypothetical protein